MKVKYIQLEILLLIVLSVSPLITPNQKLLISMFIILTSFKKLHTQELIKLLQIVLVLFLLPISIQLINTLSSNQFNLSTFIYPIYFVAGFFISKRYTKSEFILNFERVVFKLSVLSLIGMSLYFISPRLILSLPTYTQNGATHHTLFIFNYLFSDGWMMVRNTGIAWEPGVFQILLNLAFFIYLKENESVSVFKILIYFVSIFLTKSTVGLILLLINTLYYLSRNKKSILWLSVILIIFSNQIYDQIIFQITHKLQGSVSFNARLIPSLNSISVGWYRIFGIGTSAYNSSLELLDIGSFDSYTQIFLRFGYPLLVFVCFSVYKMKKYHIIFALIIIISFFGEPIWSSLLLTTMYFLNFDKKLEEDVYV